MTQEEFEQELKKGGYSFKRAGDEILVTHQGSVNLSSLERVPPDVQFQNQGSVWLRSLKSLPPGVRFENQGYVWLDSLKILPPGVQFENQRDVWLSSLVGGWFEEWAGNIEGVNPKRLLHLMIDKKLFL
jgi:hypothetical protein